MANGRSGGVAFEGTRNQVTNCCNISPRDFGDLLRKFSGPITFRFFLNNFEFIGLIRPNTRSLISIGEQRPKIQQNTPPPTTTTPYGDAAFTILMMISCGFALLALYVSVR